MKLEGKTAIITGAASGIGRVTAKKFAEEGATVVVADVDAEGGRETVEQVEADGGTATFEPLDVVDADRFETLATDVAAEHDGIDVLVNNAGIGKPEPFEETDRETLQRVFDVNVVGAWNGAQAVVPLMKVDGGGSIVNVSSVNGFRGRALYSTYCITKSALLNFTRQLAAEYGSEEIRVNAVCPGTIKTERTAKFFEKFGPMFKDEDVDPEELRQGTRDVCALDRLGEPREVANCIAFLASDEASYVTGEELVIDGGYSAQ